MARCITTRAGILLALLPGIGHGVRAQVPPAGVAVEADAAWSLVPADTAYERAAALERIGRSPFMAEQLRHPRVAAARSASRADAQRLFRDRGIAYPAARILLRVFKREHALELWARTLDDPRYRLVKTYNICALAGKLGPKRNQGDGQTPEGFYRIDGFNPTSQYHLSLHIDYPNAADARRRAREKDDPGGDIFIHGGCRTAGCIAVTDRNIEELYWIAAELHAAGQDRIPVQIFPSRLTDAEMAKLDNVFAGDAGLRGFWRTLKPGFDDFERTHRLPALDVADAGNAGPADASTPASMARPAQNDRPVETAREPATAKTTPLGSAPAGNVRPGPVGAEPATHTSAAAVTGRSRPPAAAKTKGPRVLGTPVDFPIKPGSLKATGQTGQNGGRPGR